MYKNMNENVFEGILKAAFSEYVRTQLESEPTSEELVEKYPMSQRAIKTAKKLSKKAKFGKPLAVVYLKRACVIVLVCLCLFYTCVISTANEGGIELLSKKAFLALKEKVEHIINGVTINSTTDFGDYDSLDDLKENEDINGALLPFGLNEKYSFSMIHLSDFGESKNVIIKISCDDEVVGKIDIETSVSDTFNKDNLVKVGRFDVYENHYNGGFDFYEVYQFEFFFEENFYHIEAANYDILLEITESLE